VAVDWSDEHRRTLGQVVESFYIERTCRTAAGGKRDHFDPISRQWSPAFLDNVKAAMAEALPKATQATTSGAHSPVRCAVAAPDSDTAVDMRPTPPPPSVKKPSMPRPSPPPAKPNKKTKPGASSLPSSGEVAPPPPVPARVNPPNPPVGLRSKRGRVRRNEEDIALLRQENDLLKRRADEDRRVIENLADDVAAFRREFAAFRAAAAASGASVDRGSDRP
jgi:hypothetical protein